MMYYLKLKYHFNLQCGGHQDVVLYLVILQLGISLVYLLCSSIMTEEARSRCYFILQKCHGTADVQDPLASPSSLQMV